VLCGQSGADALFVMNYPGYVGEGDDDDSYHLNHPGLGYKYTSDQALAPPALQIEIRASKAILSLF